MPKARPTRHDPLAVSGAGAAAQRELEAQLHTREKRAARARKQKRPKATYDLPLAMIEAVNATAEQEDVARSDIVAWALAEFLDRYQAGEVDLSESKRPARGLRFALKLELPGEWGSSE